SFSQNKPARILSPPNQHVGKRITWRYLGTDPSSTWWETGSPRFESQKVIRHAIARDIGTTTPSAARLPSENAAQSAIIVRRFDRADIGLDGHGAIGVLRNRA
ncbi:hypothetical protein M2307_007656, partial [Bradyrhizobium japonicum]